MSYSTQIWQIIKPLVSHIEIYEETTNEDPNTMPNSYIVYFTDVTNTPLRFADGNTLFRQSNCEIIVFTKGNANAIDNKKYVEMVEDLLIQNGINYNKRNLGYISDLGRSQVTFEFNL